MLRPGVLSPGRTYQFTLRASENVEGRLRSALAHVAVRTSTPLHGGRCRASYALPAVELTSITISAEGLASESLPLEFGFGIRCSLSSDALVPLVSRLFQKRTGWGAQRGNWAVVCTIVDAHGAQASATTEVEVERGPPIDAAAAATVVGDAERNVAQGDTNGALQILRATAAALNAAPEGGGATGLVDAITLHTDCINFAFLW